MATKRLTSLDGSLSQATIGATIVGDDATAIPTDGYYLVKGVASSGSTLPTGISTGYLAYLTTAETPATGDDVAPVTFSEMCYVQNGSVDLSRDEIETTTICDGVKTFTAGLTDLAGNFDGVFEAGNAAVLDLINKFMTTVELSADRATATVTEQNNDIFYLQLELNKASTGNEPLQFYFMPITVLTANNGISQGAAQTFSSSFRVTSDGVNEVKPAIYERAVV